MKSKKSVTLWAIFCCLLFSSAFVGIKIGLKYETPLHFAGIRFTIAGILTYFFCSNKKDYLKIILKNWKFLTFLAFLQTTLHYTLFYWGLERVDGALAAIIIGAAPLFVAITTHFMLDNDKMSFVKMLTIIGGLIGISLVAFGRNNGEEGHSELWGILMLIATNIAGSFNNILVVKEKNNIPPLVISSFALFIGGIGILLLSIPLEGPLVFEPRPDEYYYALIWLSTLSAVAISIWTKLLKVDGIIVSELNFWKFLIPVCGAILAWSILPDESPNAISIIGMGIISTSLISLNLYNRGFFGKKKQS